jgi:ABC-2 type transport system permease protein
MTSILKYESRRRSKATVVLLVFLALYLLLIVSLYPSIEQAAGAMQEYAEALPPAIQESFAIDAITTLEGFLAAEVYQFVWVLLLGLYLAYVGGGMVGSAVETGRIDLLLAAPVSRRRVLVETYLSTLVPILVLNLAMPFVVLGAVMAIGEQLSVTNLLALHFLSIPYLLLTGAIGLALSVVLGRADLAQRGGLGLIFMLFILDSVTSGTDVEWLGSLSPTRYYSPADVLIDGTIDVGGAVILFVAAVVLVVASATYFENMDL